MRRGRREPCPRSWDQADLTDDYCARRKIAPRQTFASFQTRPAEGTVADAMSESLRRTIVYEDAGAGDGDGDCRTHPPGPGRNQPESCSRPGSPPELPDRTDSDSLELTVAA